MKKVPFFIFVPLRCKIEIKKSNDGFVFLTISFYQLKSTSRQVIDKKKPGRALSFFPYRFSLNNTFLVKDAKSTVLKL